MSEAEDALLRRELYVRLLHAAGCPECSRDPEIRMLLAKHLPDMIHLVVDRLGLRLEDWDPEDLAVLQKLVDASGALLEGES